MKLKKYLYKYKNRHGKDVYVIRIKDIYVASRIKLDEIMDIYKVCEEKEWDVDNILYCLEKRKKYRTKSNKMRHIYRHPSGMYYCKKNEVYMCSEVDLDKILKYRDFLEQNNWDKKKLFEQFSIKQRRKYNTPKYIYQTPNGNYQIRKDATGYGTFDNIEDAIEERDFLMEHNWDYDFVDLV